VRWSHGFTLIEMIVGMVIILAVIAGLVPLVGLVKNSADPMITKQAESIAEALMDEVRLAGFTWCDPADANFETAADAASCASVAESMGPETGNVRPYDNVNDYNAFCATPMSPITNMTGVADVSLSGFTANICISPYALDLATPGIITTAPALKIDITVSKGATSFTLTGWRTRYAPNAS
jgi:MSHA pilin protein MshD